MLIQKILSSDLEERLGALPLTVRAVAKRMLPTLVPRYVERLDLGELATLISVVERHLGNMNEIIRGAQGNPVINEPLPEATREIFKPLEWSCRRHPDPQYILGDAAIIACFEEAAGLRHVMNGAGALNGVFLPVSSRVLLVGATPGAVLPDDETINCASSELSREFFSQRNSPSASGRSSRPSSSRPRS